MRDYRQDAAMLRLCHSFFFVLLASFLFGQRRIHLEHTFGQLHLDSLL
jgi:hypothetical protein